MLLSAVIVFIITSSTQGVSAMGNAIDTTGKTFQLMFIPWSVYLFARGIEKLHDVPMKRALVIALIPTILSIALMFLLPQFFGSGRLA